MLKGKTVSDRIFLLQCDAEEVVAGMIVPDSEKVKPCHGIVQLTGPGFKVPTTGQLIPMPVNVGDKIIYYEHSASTIAIDGVDYLQINEKDILYIF